MSDLNINGVDISKSDINGVYIDIKRNITVTLKDSKKIVIERGSESKRVYNLLSGYYADDE